MNYRFFVVENSTLVKEANAYYDAFVTTESIRNGLFADLEVGGYIETNGEVVAVSFVGVPLLGWKEAPEIRADYYKPDISCEEGILAQDILKAMKRPSFDPFRSMINSQAVHEAGQVYFASLNRLDDKWIVNIPVDPVNNYSAVPGLTELTAQQVSMIRGRPNNATIN